MYTCSYVGLGGRGLRLRRADVKPFVPELSAASLSCKMYRLRALRLIKRAARTYRYYLPNWGGRRSRRHVH